MFPSLFYVFTIPMFPGVCDGMAVIVVILGNTASFHAIIQEMLIGQRMMTISTVGVPNTIRRLAAHRLQSTLAIRYSNY